ncbi:probable protein TIC 62, chloroplastic at N-terminal half [Coccomyxa sp. Obi]|nr:probable protein TIC 62, chloroplastic at N-terminal half [Coccomyxa sp. Obi]
MVFTSHPRTKRLGVKPTCARKGDAQEEEQKPASPFAGLFGGTKKIKLGDDQAPKQAPKQAPGKGMQRLGPLGGGTQKLKLGGPGGRPGGTQRLKLGSGTQQVGRATQFLARGPPRKDPNTVFVAGATGRLGARIVRQLLLESPQLRVRAGVRDAEKAAEYLRTAVSYGLLPTDAARRVALVPLDLTDPDTITPAIGNAAKVVQAIGAPESEPFNFSNPKKIDGDGAIALVEAAKELEVDQFVMVTSLGTAKVGFPAAVLNLFGGILIQKRRAEVALEQSGLNYVIVRPGGMERPTDEYKRTHNVTLAPKDTLFGGQVSRLQVAELVAAAVANPELTENKVLEVVAETTAPLTPYEDLLSAAPSDESQADKLERLRAAAEAEEQLEAARQRVEEARAEAAEAQELVSELGAVAAEARAQAQAAAREAGPALQQAKQTEAQLERLRQAAEQRMRAEAAAKAVLAAATAAAREGRPLSTAERAEAERPILFPEEYAREQEAKRAAEEQARQKAQQEAEARAKQEAEATAKQEAAAAAAKQKQAPAAKLPPAAPKPAAPKPAAAEAAPAQSLPQKKATPPVPQVDAAEAAKRREEAAKAAREIEARALAAAEAERAKAAAEAKAKRDAEARKREEAEAKARQQAQAKAKAEAEAAAKARAEAKAKADAEAKAEQEKAQKEAGQKEAAAKAEADKARVEAAAEAKAQKEAAEKEAAAKAEADKAKADAAAKAKPASTAAAPTEKGKNAEEARRWIENWRAKQAQQASVADSQSPPKEESTPEESASSSSSSGEMAEQQGGQGWLSGFKLPWQAAQNGSQNQAASEDVPENVQEAREWIRAWRARNLEKALPSDVKARSNNSK